MSSGEVFFSSFKVDPHAEEVILGSVGWAVKLTEITRAASDSAVAAWDAAGPHPYELGDYRNSIRPYVGLEDGRYVGRVIADDYKAWWIEVGTGGETPTPAYAPLRLGADGVGLKVVASSG